MRVLLLCVAVGLNLTGCSSSYPQNEPIDLPPPTPLSVEEWKQMTDIDRKFEQATLDRLRLNDEKLKGEVQWELFMRKVVIPERKKDIPLVETPPAK